MMNNYFMSGLRSFSMFNIDCLVIDDKCGENEIVFLEISPTNTLFSD